jgi:hypothetical protein
MVRIARAKTTNNVWNDKILKDFLNYSCPECKYQSPESESFLYHVENQHSLAEKFVEINKPCSSKSLGIPKKTPKNGLPKKPKNGTKIEEQTNSTLENIDPLKEDFGPIVHLKPPPVEHGDNKPENLSNSKNGKD